MQKLYFYFPLSSSVQPGQMKTLVISLVIYLVACAVMGILQTILGWIPIVGALIRLVLSLLGLYCVAGMVLSVLKFLQHQDL